jgi:hypothetical protein
MAQTASLLESGEPPPDLVLPENDPDTTHSSEPDPKASDDGGANALISGLLSALDAVDPPAPPPDREKTDDLGEWENEVMANIGGEPKEKADAPLRAPEQDDPDDEIEFID